MSPGPAHTFDAVARAHRGALLAFATRLCRDPVEANDLVQDTLERALRRFTSLQPSSNPRAWLFTILQNGFVDRCRRKKSEPPFEPVDGADLPAEPPPESTKLPSSASFDAEALSTAIERLDEDFRVVYRMHAIEQRSYEDIAASLGIPQNTVGTRLARARRKLRDILTASAEAHR